MNARPNAKELREKAAELKEAKNAIKTVPLTVENVDRLDATTSNAKASAKPKPEKKQKPPKDPKDIKPPQPPDPNSKRSQKKLKGRLPHGSRFDNFVYDGEKVEWTGILTVPGFEVFRDRANGVMTLFSRLDKAYRRAAKERESASPVPPSPEPNCEQHTGNDDQNRDGE
jgi:hypothetical protein